MRILHTADWHLGRLFYATHLTEEQAYVLERQFFNIIQSERIDVVLISGDVFDRAVPPVEAIELWDSIVSKLLLDYKIPTIVISGNHDSGIRLEMGRQFFGLQNFHIVGQVEHSVQPVVLEDKHGPVAFHPIPFCESRDIAYVAEQLEDYKTIVGEAVFDSIYGEYVSYLHKRYVNYPRQVALAHAFVTGGIESASERPLMVGSASAVGAHVFKPFQYTALGHLHRPQRVGVDHIRYSGSLLPYSFDEVHVTTYGHDKSFTIVDLQVDGTVQLNYIPVESRRQWAILEGYFEALLVDAEAQRKYRDDYLLIRLLDEVPVIDAMARLRQVDPKVMALELVGRLVLNEHVQGSVSVKKLRHDVLFSQFVKEMRSTPLSDAEHVYMSQLWQRIEKEDV